MFSSGQIISSESSLPRAASRSSCVAVHVSPNTPLPPAQLRGNARLHASGQKTNHLSGRVRSSSCTLQARAGSQISATDQELTQSAARIKETAPKNSITGQVWPESLLAVTMLCVTELEG